MLYYGKQRMAVIWKAENVVNFSKQKMCCTLGIINSAVLWGAERVLQSKEQRMCCNLGSRYCAVLWEAGDAAKI